MKKLLILLVLLSLSVAAIAQTDYRPSDTKYDWSGLAQGIAGSKTTNYDKAYAIYRWLCDNIAYDTSYTIRDADTAYEQKRGVCQAYAELFYRLGEPLGLKVDIIFGKSKELKGNVSDVDHAWVFVYTDGNAGILIDPTWGAGSVEGSVFTRSENDDSWFHVDPEWMIFTHFPDAEAYQLLPNKIDFNTFASIPTLYPSLAQFGFKSKDLLSATLAGNRPDLPECYSNTKIAIAKIPLEGTLKIGESYDFIVKPSANYEFVIINGDEQNSEWQQDDGFHMIRFIPGADDRLVVGYRRKGSKDLWTTLVEYRMAKATKEQIAKLEQKAPAKSPTLKKLTNYSPEAYRKHGIEASKLLQTVKKENITKLPLMYGSGNYRLDNVPLNGILKAGQTYTFSFSPFEAGDWVLVNGDNWQRDWQQDPATKSWYMTITPTPGKLILAYKPQNAPDNNYHYCLEYQILP